MLWIGLVCGLVAAAIQSLTYVVSGGYVRRTGKPGWTLTAPQRLVQIVPALAIAWMFRPADALDWRHASLLLMVTALACVGGDSGLFQTQRYVEPSRVSPLQAIKIPIIALFSFFAFGTTYGVCQCVGIALILAAAVLLYDSGGRIPPVAWAWLLVCTSTYAVSDLAVGRLLTATREACGGVFASSMFCLGLSHAVCGLLAIPAYAIQRASGAPHPTGREWLHHVVPYSLLWLLAMVFLMVCFSLAGVVLGSIAQASRGVISVGLGWFLARHGFADIESRVSRAVFFRRLGAAVLVVAALVVYSFRVSS